MVLKQASSSARIAKDQEKIIVHFHGKSIFAIQITCLQKRTVLQQFKSSNLRFSQCHVSIYLQAKVAYKCESSHPQQSFITENRHGHRKRQVFIERQISLSASLMNHCTFTQIDKVRRIGNYAGFSNEEKSDCCCVTPDDFC